VTWTSQRPRAPGTATGAAVELATQEPRGAVLGLGAARVPEDGRLEALRGAAEGPLPRRRWWCAGVTAMGPAPAAILVPAIRSAALLSKQTGPWTMVPSLCLPRSLAGPRVRLRFMAASQNRRPPGDDLPCTVQKRRVPGRCDEWGQAGTSCRVRRAPVVHPSPPQRCVSLCAVRPGRHDAARGCGRARVVDEGRRIGAARGVVGRGFKRRAAAAQARALPDPARCDIGVLLFPPTASLHNLHNGRAHVKRCCARAIAGGVFDGLALTTARAPKPLSSSSRLPLHHIASRGGAIVTTARQRRHTFSQLPRRGHNRCPCSLVTRASPTHLQRMNRPQPPPSVPQNLRLFQHRQE
jgi:hypothetical protein